jgi:hypothetical protein
MTSIPAAPVSDLDRDDPPFSPTLVEELLRQLDKTVRARQLYMANNPTYQRSLETLRAAFAPVWANTDSLVLTVHEAQFKWYGVTVHQQPEKATDSIPWLCYKDGLREITLTPGFEGDELDEFIELIPRVRRAAVEEDDLVTLMWEQEFTTLSYRHVDLGSDSASPITSGDDPGRYPGTAGGALEDPSVAIDEARAEVAAVGGGGEAGAAATPRPGVVSMEDFDSTLYFLDEKEITIVKQELDAEYNRDLRRTVLDSLFDIFELQVDPRVRGEVAGQLAQLLLHLLSAARFDTVAYMLSEIKVVLDRSRDVEPATRNRLAELPHRLSSPETLSQVLQQLDDSTTLPAQEHLSALFSELQPTALETVFQWLGRVRDERLRTLLEAAADRLAAANTGELVRLIGQGSGAAVLEAIRRAGALKTPAAVAPLAKVLGEPARDVRLAAAQALVEIGSPGSMQMLERALSDSDREVRVLAVRALAAKGQRSSLARIDLTVKSKELREADLSERMAFFEAYGALCGDAGITFLDGLLNGKSGFLGRREDPEIRACAAIALGRIGSPRAEESLQKAASEKDVVVRNAVSRALRGTP